MIDIIRDIIDSKLGESFSHAMTEDSMWIRHKSIVKFRCQIYSYDNHVVLFHRGPAVILDTNNPNFVNDFVDAVLRLAGEKNQ